MCIPKWGVSIAEEVRGGSIKKIMEGNYVTPGDLALYGGGYGYGRRGGAAATGIGLAAGLGGGALLLAIAGLWGINQASKARSVGNSRAIDILANQAILDRQSRETWQNTHAPSISQYVDVQAGAGAGAGANALATAEAYALLTGGNSRNGQVCPQPVALYQPAMPCSCNTCGN